MFFICWLLYFCFIFVFVGSFHLPFVFSVLYFFFFVALSHRSFACSFLITYLNFSLTISCGKFMFGRARASRNSTYDSVYVCEGERECNRESEERREERFDIHSRSFPIAKSFLFYHFHTTPNSLPDVPP